MAEHGGCVQVTGAEWPLAPPVPVPLLGGGCWAVAPGWGVFPALRRREAAVRPVPARIGGDTGRSARPGRRVRAVVPEMILMDVADVPEYAVDVAFIPRAPG